MKPKNKRARHLNDLEAAELIWGPPETILREQDMRPYQTWMADKIVELPGILLGAEMGLGKTGATLLGARRCFDAGIVRKGLIIAPLLVAEETWPAEIAKWEFARDLTYRVVTGSEDERLAALRDGPRDLTIINRENLGWLYRRIGHPRWPFDLIIYDEASRLKRGVLRTSPKPNKSGEVPPPQLTELGIINKVRSRTKKIVELSGTPNPNGLIDLFGPMFGIDGGERLGRSKNAYESRWFKTNPYTREVTPLPHAEDEIMGLVKDRYFSLREEDYLTLPPVVPVDHYVTLPKPLLARYKEFEREMAIDVLNSWDQEETIEAVNKGVLTGKLLQFANGSLYNSDKQAIRLHDLKLDVLSSIVEEANGSPILCAYSFQFDLEAIKKRFRFARVFGQSKSDMRDWNAGRIPLMLLHPASAGHGLNFQYASNIAVWYGLTWSSELYQQFNKRLPRSGQKHDKVFLHRIMARKTMDENILPVLQDRKATEDRIKAAVKAQLERAAA